MKTLVFHQSQTNTAEKWLTMLFSQKEITLLYQAFHEVTETDLSANLAIDKCYVAVIAAEVLSHLVGYSRIPPVIEADKIEPLTSFLIYNQCKLRMIRLAIESTERILTMDGDSAIRKKLGANLRDFDLWIGDIDDLLNRLSMAERRFSV